jgi:hypothetical protein
MVRVSLSELGELVVELTTNEVQVEKRVDIHI